MKEKKLYQLKNEDNPISTNLKRKLKEESEEQCSNLLFSFMSPVYRINTEENRDTNTRDIAELK